MHNARRLQSMSFGEFCNYSPQLQYFPAKAHVYPPPFNSFSILTVCVNPSRTEKVSL